LPKPANLRLAASMLLGLRSVASSEPPAESFSATSPVTVPIPQPISRTR
jgi:hypothetical protein